MALMNARLEEKMSVAVMRTRARKGWLEVACCRQAATVRASEDPKR